MSSNRCSLSSVYPSSVRSFMRASSLEPPLLLFYSSSSWSLRKVRNASTDQTLTTRSLLEARVLLENGEANDSCWSDGAVRLDDFFVVNVWNAKDKVELLLLCGAPLIVDRDHYQQAGSAGAAVSASASASASSPLVLGSATLPHHDERIFGTEVGLKLQLASHILGVGHGLEAAGINPMGRSGDGEGEPSCIVKLVATWSDKANEESGSDNKGRRKSTMLGVVDVFPKSLIVNLIGFTAINLLDPLYSDSGDDEQQQREGALPPEPSLYVECVNTTTGQVHRSRTQRNTRFPIYEVRERIACERLLQTSQLIIYLRFDARSTRMDVVKHCRRYFTCACARRVIASYSPSSTATSEAVVLVITDDRLGRWSCRSRARRSC
jgi:hypothetical protein